SGRLQRLMADYTVPLTEMWLVFPSRQLITPAVRLIRDELKLTINELRAQLIAKGTIDAQEWPESP
ncbi:LysR family transcriptional regulator, partial [Pseudoalteromonas piscicida]